MSTGAERAPLWTASFALFTLANMGVSAVFYLLVPTMAPYATERFGADPGQAGLAASIFFLGALSMRFVAGGVIGRIGAARSVGVTLLLKTLAVAAYFATGSLAALLIVRFVHGMTFALAQTALTSAVMRSLPPARRGEGTGYFTAGLALMTGLGPAIGLHLLSTYGMTSVLRVALGASVLATISGVIAVSVARRRRGAHGRLDTLATSTSTSTSTPTSTSTSASTPTAARAEQVESSGAPGRLRAFLAPEAFPVALVVASSSIAYSLVIAFFGTYMAERGLTSVVGPYFLVYAAVSFVARPLAGPVQDRRGDAAVLVPCLAAVIAGTLLTGFGGSALVIVLGGALLGGGYGTLISAGQAAAVSRAGVARSGQAVSSFFLVVDAFTGLAPALLGGLAVVVGYPWLFSSGALAGALGLVYFLAGPGRTAHRRPS